MTSSAAVLADAQFSAVRVFKPFRGFEEFYQGQPGDLPIAIPGDLDSDAGKIGFDPNLLAGIPVPFGSKMVLWMPTIFNLTAGNGFVVKPYRYTLIWRLRNLRDFRTKRVPYHFPRQSFGENQQFIVPSGVNTIITNGMPRSVAVLNSQFSSYRSSDSELGIENITVQSVIPKPAISPRGENAAFQQGLAQGNVGSNTTVTFNPWQLDVLGDELMIIVNKPEGDTADWNFEDVGSDQSDSGFSAFFGTASGTRDPLLNMGIYLFTGSNP
ncbi:MAG: hypothetical protein ACTS8S_14205 [Giesbergeria sp.]